MNKEPKYAWKVTCPKCNDYLTLEIKEYTASTVKKIILQWKLRHIDERHIKTHGGGEFIARPNPLFFCGKCGQLCKVEMGIINEKDRWEKLEEGSNHGT